jgi:hypothetical protein
VAISFCEDEGFDGKTILEVAEEIRFQLSHCCPKGTKKPYVSEDEQVKFTFKTMF